MCLAVSAAARKNRCAKISEKNMQLEKWGKSFRRLRLLYLPHMVHCKLTSP